jgi:arginyl-tRNA synthetase
MIKERLAAIVSQAISSAQSAGAIGLSVLELQSLPIVIEQPRSADHGDLYCPVAMQIVARLASPCSSFEVAQTLVSYIKTRSEDLLYFTRVEAAAPGFINFDLGPRLCAEILLDIVSLANDYGLISDKTGQHLDVSLFHSNEPEKTQLNQSLYAYARCTSILRQVQAPRVNVLSGQFEDPLMTADQWQTFLLDCKNKLEIYLEADFFPSDTEKDLSGLRRSQTALILKLAYFPEAVAAAANCRESERLARYTLDLAEQLSDFWGQFNLGEGFFSPQLSVLKARLGLILATRQVLANALGIIGMPVPEQI